MMDDFDLDSHHEGGSEGPYDEISGFLDIKTRREQIGLFDDEEWPLPPKANTTIQAMPIPNRPAPGIDGLFSCFLPTQKRNTFIGDLEERYGLIAVEQGHRSATLWFWREVIHSFFSLAWDAMKRVSGLEWLYRRIGS